MHALGIYVAYVSEKLLKNRKVFEAVEIVIEVNFKISKSLWATFGQKNVFMELTGQMRKYFSIGPLV